MKTEMKVLLYLKKNEQNDEGLCPLMGKITVKGKNNSFVQFGCKIHVNPQLWNATSQRCTGKSRVAVSTNRQIESLLLLLRARFNELRDLSNSVLALEVKNAFQGIVAAQTTLLDLFAEHNADYALRVGVNRAATTYYQLLPILQHLSHPVGVHPLQVQGFRCLGEVSGLHVHRSLRLLSACGQTTKTRDNHRPYQPT